MQIHIMTDPHWVLNAWYIGWLIERMISRCFIFFFVVNVELGKFYPNYWWCKVWSLASFWRFSYVKSGRFEFEKSKKQNEGATMPLISSRFSYFFHIQSINVFKFEHLQKLAKSIDKNKSRCNLEKKVACRRDFWHFPACGELKFLHLTS